MKKAISILLLTFLPFLLSAQEKISNFSNEYPEKYFENEANGIFAYDQSDEYFVDRSQQKLNIYKLSNDGFEFKHSIDQTIEERYRLGDSNDYAFDRPKTLAIEKYIIEVYLHYIIIFDVTTGELHDQIDLESEGLELGSETINKIGTAGFTYIAEDGSGSKNAYSYFFESKEISLLNFNLESKTFYSGSEIAFRISDNEVEAVDLISNSLLYIYEFPEGIFSARMEFSKDKEYLTVIPNTKEFVILDKQGKLNLDFIQLPSAIKNYYKTTIKDNKLFLSFRAEDSSDRRNQIYDLNTGELIFETNSIYGSFYNSFMLPEDHILLQDEGNYWTDGKFILINTATLTFDTLDLQVDLLQESKELFHDDKWYVVGYNVNSSLNNKPRSVIFEIDISTKDVQIRSEPEGILSSFIQLGRKSTNEYFHYTVKNFDQQDEVWRYNYGDDHAYKLEDSPKSKFAGINSVEYSLTVGNTIYFNDRYNLYQTKGSETIKLASGGFVFPIVEGNNSVHTIELDSFNLYRIIIKGDEIEKSLLLPNYYTFPYKRSMKNGILINYLPYYDALTGDFIDIPFDSNSEIARYLAQGEHTFFGEVLIDGEYKFYGYDLISKEVSVIDKNRETHEIFHINNDKYLLIEVGKHAINEERTVSIIDVKGKVIDEGKINYNTLFIDSFEGKYSYASSGNNFSISLIDDDQFVYLTYNNNNFYTSTLPTEDYLFDHGYHQIDSIVIVTIYEYGEKNIYLLIPGKQPKKIDTLSRYDSFNEFYEYQGNIIIPLYNYSNGRGRYLQFDLQDFETKETILMEGIDFSHVQSPLTQLNDRYFIVTWNDGTHGREPAILDLENITIEPIKDLYPGIIGSNPEHLSQIGNDYYFTAFDENYFRQVYRLTLEDSIVHVKEVSCNNLIVYPNPSSQSIAVDGLLNSLQITDISGNTVYKIENYKDSPIDISDFPRGVYILYGTDIYGKFCKGKFVKME